MKLNNLKIHTDILIKLNSLDKTQVWLSKKLNVSSMVIRNLRNNGNIRTNNLFKILTWLDNGIEKYIE
jgi:hypothetical protein